MTTMTMTVNGVDVTMTGDPAELGVMVSKLTSNPTTPKASRSGSKSRKSRKGKAAPKGPRFVRSSSIEQLGELLGYDFSDWSLKDLLDGLREETIEGWEGLPEGWAFGPASEHYLANGEFPS